MREKMTLTVLALVLYLIPTGLYAEKFPEVLRALKKG
jgi:hypothetical protein